MYGLGANEWPVILVIAAIVAWGTFKLQVTMVRPGVPRPGQDPYKPPEEPNNGAANRSLSYAESIRYVGFSVLAAVAICVVVFGVLNLITLANGIFF